MGIGYRRIDVDIKRDIEDPTHPRLNRGLVERTSRAMTFDHARNFRTNKTANAPGYKSGKSGHAPFCASTAARKFAMNAFRDAARRLNFHACPRSNRRIPFRNKSAVPIGETRGCANYALDSCTPRPIEPYRPRFVYLAATCCAIESVLTRAAATQREFHPRPFLSSRYTMRADNNRIDHYTLSYRA